ncbi:unnamed protein product [Mytilus coruscus]|uniref:Uncharacterized protein n=1 Tax=Mytilus coruscus TaxID=42192 RepID=A0A6J8CH35_MYTCO|nr:unnamed protein product [Mytilus coruscus]
MLAKQEQVYVSLEDSNSIRINVKPDKNAMGIPKWITTNTDGKIKVVAFYGKVRPQFQRKGTDFPIGTKQLSEYVDPVCSDNFTVVGSSNTSIAVMWDSGLDRGHNMDTILQYRVDGSSDWLQGYIMSKQSNQKENYTITDLKPGASYDIRLLTSNGNRSSAICKSHVITERTMLAKQEQVYVSLEDSNNGKIKVVAFYGKVRPQFQRKVYLENETSIYILNLSFEEWNSIWTYQKGTDFPIGTKQLSEYVDPVCSDNFTVVGSSNTSISVMWDSGLDRGHHMVTILQYRVDGSSDWMSAYNTTEHINQEVNFSIPDLKQGTSYDIRLLTSNGNKSSAICKSHVITERTMLAKQVQDIARASEAADQHSAQFEEVHINRVQVKRDFNAARHQRHDYHSKRKDIECHRCGRTGHIARECTVAMDKACHKCGKMGHFAKEMQEQEVIKGTRKVLQEGKMDSGATCNIINSEIMSKLKKCGVNKIPIEKQLYAYGAINPLMIKSKIRSDITCEESRKCVKADFMVIDGNHTPLLGRSTASKLKDYQLKIYINKNVKPIAQPTRRLPFNIRKSVEEKLCELEEMDVIERVEGPTEWVSPLVVVPKRNSEIRICVDMRRANEAVKRSRHPIPTVDEILQELNGAKVYSKIDLRMGFHQVELEPESRNITTFTTHVGLFRYKRLMFGISCTRNVPTMH